MKKGKSTAGLKRVRVIKSDTHNWAVQVRKLMLNPDKSVKYDEDGNKVRKWETVGVYGNHLDWAIRNAVMEMAEVGTVLTPELFEEAIATLSKEFKKQKRTPTEETPISTKAKKKK